MTVADTQTAAPSDKELSARRIAGRAAFAALLRRHLDLSLSRGFSFVSSWASVLGVGEGKMRRWAQPDHIRSAIAAGDLHALPAAELADLLRFWLADVEASIEPAEPATDPRLLVVVFAEAIGDLAKSARKAMVDRRVTHPEWAELEAKFAAIERDARVARLACEAARKSGGAR